MTLQTETHKLQARIEYLEDNRRYIQNALETVLSLGEFQTSAGNHLHNVEQVLQQAGQKICGLIPFSSRAFYLVDDESFLFELSHCDPAGDRERIEQEIEGMIDQGMFAWAVREKRGVFIPVHAGEGQYLLHVISSTDHIRGMFVGRLTDRRQSIADTSLMLLSILLMRVADALEELEFRRYLENQKEILEEKVARRTAALTRSEAHLKQSMQQARQLAREAKKASAAKSDFLAKMSHELRTPLNGIIGMTEVALATRLDDNQKQLLKTVERESNSLLKIINDILDFSKVEAGKLEIEQIPFDLREIIDEVGDTMALQAARKGLELSTFLPPDLPSRLMGDPLRLKQILLNLAGNAVKFTQQGEIHIGGRMVRQGHANATIELMVQDTGIGIPKAKHATIFQGFSQADDSTTRKYGGTGLGITISNQLVKLMGGTLEMQSEENKGSTFRFTLSLEQQGAGVAQKPQSLSPLPLNVLVAGAASSGRQVLDDYLRALGCRVTLKDNAKLAWQQLAASSSLAQSWDLVFTNVRMPEMTGTELAAKINALPEERRVPVVAVTGIRDLMGNNTAETSDFHCQLAKPLKWSALKALIHALGNGEPVSATEHLPAIDEPAQNLHVSDGRNPYRILLVDDYPTNRKVAGMHLSAAGFQIDMAEDGRQAVDAYKQSAYDLVLMDIQMPVMDGYDATRRIRRWESDIKAARCTTQGPTLKDRADDPSISPPDRVPIIAMTAHAFEEDARRCRSAGMDDFIAKPIRREGLLSTVTRWLSNPAPAREEKKEPMPLEATFSATSEKNCLPMDLPTAVEEFGSQEVVMEVLDQLIGNMDGQLEIMTQALDESDARRLQRESHAIKGGAWTVEARPLGDIAAEIEQLSRNKDLTSIGPRLNTLVVELKRLKTYATALKRGEENAYPGH